PGSFNGLRVGVSTAKGLAFGLGVPIVGISTLEMIAYAHAETGIPVCAIINAGKSEVASVLFQQKNGKWEKLIPEHITTIEILCQKTDTATIFCGELTQATIDELTEKLGSKAIVPSASARLRRSGFLAELGFKQLQSCNYDNPASLQPIYLRKPPITPHKNMAPLCADEL
ncbi:MAG: tRNA (adenosine(37)-N6)-threonylcarbamoyltransferase complex dimerization subunit type 1 TsaB, partial [Dehalococcoidales bacterium]|nr:tRNA (adenosine(37)-N6)-threonylcarbamoyltransferase complex dimerization subunit type 1 TsaB [Dehalococcoidales bacterium]